METNIDVMFDFGSQVNLIVIDIVNKIGLEVHYHPIPYPLGWVKKDTYINLMKQCKIKFDSSVYFIDELELVVVSLDVCGVVFRIPYLYMT
jgi:hypothetical protein